jgi:hypothetical protein
VGDAPWVGYASIYATLSSLNGILMSSDLLTPQAPLEPIVLSSPASVGDPAAT